MTETAQTNPNQERREKAEPSKRKQLRMERLKKVRDAHEPRKVRVTPATDEMRKILVHPRAGGFRSTGSVEWPLDAFTKRRIQSGSVTAETRERENREKSAPEHAPQHVRRMPRQSQRDAEGAQGHAAEARTSERDAGPSA